MRSPARQTLVLSVVVYFVMVGVSIISPVLPKYGLSFGVSVAFIGGLIAGFGLARLFLDIPAGFICDRVGIRRFMIYGLVTIVASSILAGLAVDYWMLLIGRILEGAGSAFYTTTSLTAVGRVAPRESRGKHLSFYLSMLLLGSVSGPAMGGFVGETFGLNAPFFLYALFASVSIILVYAFIDDSPGAPICVAKEDRPQLSQLGHLIKDYTLASINAVTFAVFIIRMGILSTIVPLFAYNNLGLGAASLGIVLTFNSLCNFISMLPAGSLTDRFGRKYFLFSSIFLSGLIIILIPFSSDIVSFAFLMAALGFTLGMAGPIAAWIADVTKPKEMATAMGLFRTAGDLGFVVGPILLAGLVSSETGSVGLAPFLFAGLLVSGMAILLLRARDPVGEMRRKERAWQKNHEN